MQKYIKVVLKYNRIDKQNFNYWVGKSNVTILKTKTKPDGEYATILMNNHKMLNLFLTILNKECLWGVQVHKVKTKWWWR